jgi:hypothetical protein
MIRILFALALSLSMASCQKKDPHPELLDPIYSDMKAELANAETQVVEVEKKVLEMEKEMKNARPQSGDYRKYQKYFFQNQNSLVKYKQQVLYWKIRIAQRKSAVHAEYSKAFEEGKPWPDQKVYQEYLSRKKLRVAKLNWDTKQRLSDSQSPREPSGASAGGEAASKSAH